jgi:hypothetical protein
VLRRLTAELAGLRVSARRVARCRLAQASEPELTDVLAACRRAQVGSGRVLTLMGLEHDLSDQAPCDLDARLFNLGRGRLALRLDRRTEEDCLVDPQAAIIATMRRGRLSFAVPPDLRHPVPGLEVAVTRVQLTTRLGFFKARGCSARRLVRVTAADEAGGKLRRELRAAC